MSPSQVAREEKAKKMVELYHYFYNGDNRIAAIDEVAKEVGVSVNTVRAALKRDAVRVFLREWDCCKTFKEAIRIAAEEVGIEESTVMAAVTKEGIEL